MYVQHFISHVTSSFSRSLWIGARSVYTCKFILYMCYYQHSKNVLHSLNTTYQTTGKFKILNLIYCNGSYIEPGEGNYEQNNQI